MGVAGAAARAGSGTRAATRQPATGAAADPVTFTGTPTPQQPAAPAAPATAGRPSPAPSTSTTSTTSAPAGPRSIGSPPPVVDDGAGLLLAAMGWCWVVLPFLRGGMPEVRKVVKAKFFNKAPDGSWLP